MIAALSAFAPIVERSPEVAGLVRGQVAPPELVGNDPVNGRVLVRQVNLLTTWQKVISSSRLIPPI